MKLFSLFALISITLGLYGCASDAGSTIASSASKPDVKVLDSKNARLESIITKQEGLLAKRPTDGRALNTLGIAYIQKARETGDLAWYVKGRKVLEQAVESGSKSTTSLHNLAYAMTIFHEYDKALALAQRAITLDPGDADAFGVLCDAYYEQGQYEKAAEAAQQMIDLRPGLASYSRGAQIRWIMGSPKGAIVLMQKAIEAGGSYPETTAWCRVQLATMAFQTGNVLQAEQVLEAVLKDLPDYRHAQAALAKVRVSQKRFVDAVKLLQSATSGGTPAVYVLDLADLHKRMGNTDLANQAISRLSKLRDENLQYGIAGDEIVLGTAMVDHDGDLAAALELLAAEAKAHDSVTANSAYAWALLKSGNASLAKRYSDRSMRTNVQDALVWYRAACVERALGNALQSRQLIAKVQSLNPNFSTLHAESLYASR